MICIVVGMPGSIVHFFDVDISRTLRLQNSILVGCNEEEKFQLISEIQSKNIWEIRRMQKCIIQLAKWIDNELKT
jgi:hypothetical protein